MSSNHPWQGIELKIHPTFWIVIFLAVWTGHFIEILTLFILVIVHELGHVTAAWLYDWRIHSIEILPFGGVAKMEEWGTVPAREEAIVALAGPFYHLWLILVSLILWTIGIWDEHWTEYFIICNMWLFGFNMLPIYPLDGGRILQLVLSYFQSYRRCIQHTLLCSLILSCALFTISIVWMHLPLAVLSLFLIISNLTGIKEKEYQYLRFLLYRLHRPLQENTSPHIFSVSSEQPISEVMKTWYKERYHLWKVIDPKGKDLGMIPEELVIQHFFSKGKTISTIGDCLVQYYMDAGEPTAKDAHTIDIDQRTVLS